MLTKITKKFGFALGCLAAVFIFTFVCGISWIATCGIVYLITLCFNWTFSWVIATGVWLVLWLLSSTFKQGSDKK